MERGKQQVPMALAAAVMVGLAGWVYFGERGEPGAAVGEGAETAVAGRGLAVDGDPRVPLARGSAAEAEVLRERAVGVGVVSGVLRQAAVGERWELEGFGGERLGGLVERAAVDVNGTWSVVGGVDGGGGTGRMIGSVSGGRVRVEVDLPAAGRRLVWVGGGDGAGVRLSEVDRAVQLAGVGVCGGAPPSGPGAGGSNTKKKKKAGADGGAKSHGDGQRRLDLLIVYTEDARLWAEENGGIDNVLAQVVQKTQVSFDNSGLGMDVTLVRSEEVDYTESRDSSTDLRRLTFPAGHADDLTGEMEEVFPWRNQSGADLVALLVRTMDSGVAGRAWRLSDRSGNDDRGFSVTKISAALAGNTFAHELGHNFGCHHSRNQTDNEAPAAGGLFDYSTGWRWTGTDGEEYCSIMTYSDGAEQVPVFSSPDLTWAGTATGSYDTADPDVGGFAPADNVRTFEETRDAVTGYREERPYLPPPVMLLVPNGGEYWERGQTRRIRWTAEGAIVLRIEYSLDDGATWTVIEEDAPAGLGRYDWTLPELTSVACRVRLTVPYAEQFFDTSAGTFTITDPAVGEWDVDEVAEGSYSSLDDVQFIDATTGWAGYGFWNTDTSRTEWKVVKTTDGGQSWVPSGEGTQGGLEQLHFIDADRGWSAVNRITTSGTDAKILGTTDGGATWSELAEIQNTAVLALHFADGDRGWAGGYLKNPSGGSSNLKVVWWTTDGGASWLPPTDMGYGKIEAVDFVDTTRGWAVGSPGTIHRTTNGGAGWSAQAVELPVALRAVDFVDADRGWVAGDAGVVMRTVDGGATWESLTSGTPADLTSVVFVDALRGWVAGIEGVIMATSDGGVTWRREASHTSADIKALAFSGPLHGVAVGTSLTTVRYEGYPPELRWTAPLDGAAWRAGSEQELRWNGEYLTRALALEYRVFGTPTWQPVAAALQPETAHYQWTVPDDAGGTMELRVREDDDGASAVVGVQVLPGIEVDVPAGGERWRVGRTERIGWQSDLPAGTRVDVEYSTDGGSSWGAVVSDFDAGEGGFDWEVPATVSEDCVVRVRRSDGTAMEGSSGTFTIFLPAVELVAPLGGEVWAAGSVQTVRWTAVDTAAVELEYSTSGGTRWETIASGVDASLGSYAWTVPLTASTQATVRVTKSDNATVRDASEALRIEPASDMVEFLRSLDVGLAAVDIALGDSGEVAVLAAGLGGIRVMDVSDPAAPVEVGELDLPGTSKGVAVSGGIAYVAAGDAGLRIVDVSDPGAPVEVGSLPLPMSANDVAVSGGHAFVVEAEDGRGTLWAVDVSDPAAPAMVDVLGGMTNPQRIALEGDHAYIGDLSFLFDANPPPGGFRVVDVSDPAALSEEAFVQVAGTVWSLAVADGVVYTAEWLGATEAGVRAYDVSSPSSPTAGAFRPTVRFPVGFGVGDGRLYVHEMPGTSAEPGRVTVLDPADGAGLPLLGWCDIGRPLLGAGGLDVEGDVVFAANTVDGLLVLRDETVVVPPPPPPPPVPVPVVTGTNTVSGRVGEFLTFPVRAGAYLVTDPMRRRTAEALAPTLGGTLVKIEDREEQAALTDVFLAGANDRRVLWIGLSDVLREGLFLWDDRTRASFTNWERLQPDDAGRREDYVVMNLARALDPRAPKGTWSDVPDTVYPALVELGVDPAAAFSAIGLPEGLKIDPGTGEITGAPRREGTGLTRVVVRMFGETGSANLRFDIGPEPGFDDWMDGQPPSELPPAGERDPEDDPNGDGVSNAAAYAMNLSVVEPVSGEDLPRSGTVVVDGDEYWTLSYRQRRDAPGMVVGVEVSDGLAPGSWRRGDVVAVSLEPLDGETDLITVRSQEAIVRADGLFVRLVFELQRR